MLLVLEMGIEGRAADVGAVDDVLHGDGLVAFLEDQFDEGAQQQLARTPDAPVGKSFFFRMAFLS